MIGEVVKKIKFFKKVTLHERIKSVLQDLVFDWPDVRSSIKVTISAHFK